MEIRIPRKFAILAIFLLCVVCTTVVRGAVFAEDPTPTATPTPSGSSEKLSSLQDQIKELQAKVNDLANQGKTLSSQISAMDSQIKLTQLRIAATKQEIEDLGGDISTVGGKITKLEGSLEKLSKALIARIKASYQTGSAPAINMLLTAGSPSDFVTRLNYLKAAQARDRDLLLQTTQAKNDYTNQRQILEGKKEKVESLKVQLEGYTAQLDKDKAEKENLLAVTKNSEKEYQRRLSDALRELRQIQKAAQVLISTESRKVSKGEAIGLMGNTGYSFGAHLHFGIYNISRLEDYNYYSSHENPASSLQSQSVSWQTGCGGDPVGSSGTGSGSFEWPMSTGSLQITQNYGHTCYSNAYYSGNPHPAFDMYNNSDIVVRAVEEGQAYFCQNCTGDGANGVFIFHPNGKMSLYWHLQ